MNFVSCMNLPQVTFIRFKDLLYPNDKCYGHEWLTYTITATIREC